MEITGGEPMEQVSCKLMKTLIEEGSVLLETGGHILCDKVPTEVRKIIDEGQLLNGAKIITVI